MSRHGQPIRKTCSMHLRKQLIPSRRAQRPRSGGSSGPITSHSACDKSPRPMTAPQKTVSSQKKPGLGIPLSTLPSRCWKKHHRHRKIAKSIPPKRQSERGSAFSHWKIIAAFSCRYMSEGRTPSPPPAFSGPSSRSQSCAKTFTIAPFAIPIPSKPIYP